MQYKSEYENDNFYRYTHTLESRIIGGVEIIGGGGGVDIVIIINNRGGWNNSGGGGGWKNGVGGFLVLIC